MKSSKIRSFLTILLLLATAATNSLAKTDVGSRSARFSEWKKRHAEVGHEITALKIATSQMIEQYREQEQADARAQRHRLIAAVRALTPEQNQHVSDLVKAGLADLKSSACDAAMDRFSLALEINSAQARALNGMGECLRRAGKPAEAAAYLMHTAMLPPLDPDTELARLMAMTSLQTLPVPPDPRVDAAPKIFRVPNAPLEIWDAADVPVMTVIPAGEYTMGSPRDEIFANGTETPHRVTIGYPLAIGKYNVTRGEFAVFVAVTGYDANGGLGCNAEIDGQFTRTAKADWRSPGFAQTDDDPVVCINYYDATAYVDWLSHNTGHKYRLPSEAEWEYAVRAGTTTIYYWGNEIATGHANCDGCNGPSHEHRTTLGRTYPPNTFGLYDMSGNVWKWFSDCWNNNYVGAPTDGSSWQSGNCELRSRRSGSWFNLAERRPGDPREPGRLRAAGRFGSIPELRYSSYGFRVVREL